MELALIVDIPNDKLSTNNMRYFPSPFKSKVGNNSSS